MVRKVSEPSIDELGTQRHPAFGVVSIGRPSGAGRPLFQSDLLHNNTITLTISRAARNRSLHQDWVHLEEELVEVEMSLAQWGALVSSVGGRSTPVTIRHTETDGLVDDLPHQPRSQQTMDEVRAKTEEMLAGVTDALAELRAAFDDKQGIRAQREALAKLERKVSQAPGNAHFAAESMTEAIENTVSAAKADIEAHILATQTALGIGSSVGIPTWAPSLPELEG